jgi:hypothetical protein
MTKSALGLILALTGITLSAGACPDLSGAWACKTSDDQTYHATVTQTEIPSGQLYRIKDTDGSDAEYRADGIKRTSVDGNTVWSDLVTCKNNSAVEAVSEIRNSEDNFEGKITQSLTKSSATTLKLRSVIWIKFQGVSDTKVMTTNCRRP